MSLVEIYTTSVCPYCEAAKKLFHSLNIEYQDIDLTNNADLRSKLSSENKGWRTVPMIFINKKFIGGFDDVRKLHQSGDLLKLLNT